jgi:hypothetical protein
LFSINILLYWNKTTFYRYTYKPVILRYKMIHRNPTMSSPHGLVLPEYYVASSAIDFVNNRDNVEVSRGLLQFRSWGEIWTEFVQPLVLKRGFGSDKKSKYILSDSTSSFPIFDLVRTCPVSLSHWRLARKVANEQEIKIYSALVSYVAKKRECCLTGWKEYGPVLPKRERVKLPSFLEQEPLVVNP